MIPLIEFSKAGFAYGDREIFGTLDARIEAQDCIALIGPNGAGKTTLLRLAAGSVAPLEGEVLLNGRPMHKISKRELARSIAFVPQDVETAFSMTVEQFVQQGRTPFLSLFGSLNSEDCRSVERAMVLTDSWQLRSRIFNQLSGGERQRVKIALALAQQPRLLLLDEPLQHLDLGRKMEMIELIQSLRSQGIAIVAAMHDLNLIEGAFSSVWMVSPGLAMLEGTPREMLSPELLEAVFNCRTGQLASYAIRPGQRLERVS